MHQFSEEDLKWGVLAPLGPYGLDIVKLCRQCRLLTYQSDSRISSFKPPAGSLVQQMKLFLPLRGFHFEFCSCDDVNEQFRKEFQNKCMVVNQDVGPGAEKKVQCILVSKDSRCLDHGPEQQQYDKGDKSLKELTFLAPLMSRVSRVSTRLRLCERCGVEETQMSACRQCNKVWYCSPACKRADVKQHSAVCRAHISVRRHTEERAEFSAKLREPEDGCGNCGFWRDSLEPCAKCHQVSYCCYRCKDKSAERHRLVCEAFTTIEEYRAKRQLARRQEID